MENVLDTRISNSEKSKNILEQTFKIKNKKLPKYFSRLQKQLSKKSIQTDIFLAIFIATVIFLFFSLLLLFSISFITNGYTQLSSNLFYNDNASSIIDKTKSFSFYFGIYQYTFNLTLQTPVSSDGSPVSNLLNGNPYAPLAVLLGTYKGPNLNWFGILFIVFQGLILISASCGLASFTHYSKLLKYNPANAKLRWYFKSAYILIIIFVILGGLVTEINFIPGSSLIEKELLKYYSSMHYPKTSSSSSSSSSGSSGSSSGSGSGSHSSSSGSSGSSSIGKLANQAINILENGLTVNGSGLNVPIAVFGMLHIRITSSEVDNNKEYWFQFKIFNSSGSYVVIAFFSAFLIDILVMIFYIFRNYDKYQSVNKNLINDIQIREIIFNK